MVYLERLKKLRAAGGLAETGNVDQENVENYSARVKAESGSQGQGCDRRHGPSCRAQEGPDSVHEGKGYHHGSLG